MLLSTADCSGTQAYTRNKRTFHYNLSTLAKQEQRYRFYTGIKEITDNKDSAFHACLHTLLIDVTLKL